MQKLLLLSVVFAVLGIPVIAARDGNGVRAAKKTIVLVAAFNLLYLLIIRYVYLYLQ